MNSSNFKFKGKGKKVYENWRLLHPLWHCNKILFGFLGAICKRLMPSIQARCVWNMLDYICLEVYLVYNLPTCTLESFELNTNWLDMVAVIDRVCYIKLKSILARLFEKKFRGEVLGKCSFWKKIFFCIHYLHLVFP